MPARLVTPGTTGKKGKGGKGTGTGTGGGATVRAAKFVPTNRYFCSNCGFNENIKPENLSCPTCGKKVEVTVA